MLYEKYYCNLFQIGLLFKWYGNFHPPFKHLPWKQKGFPHKREIQWNLDLVFNPLWASLFFCPCIPLSFLFDSVLQNSPIPVQSKNFPGRISQGGFIGLKPQESLARLFLYRFIHITPWDIILTLFGSKIFFIFFFFFQNGWKPYNYCK